MDGIVLTLPKRDMWSTLTTSRKFASQKAAGVNRNLRYEVRSLFDSAGSKVYDGIYLSNVIHLFLREEREMLLSHMTSLLKPGGVLILTCISVSDASNYGHGVEIESHTFMKHENKSLHFYTEEELDEIFSDDYQILEKKLHEQTEKDPSGDVETLKLLFVAARKIK
ncbi:hypothetical protein [Rossellomorea marisflavi]|uniref:hypothetical protein n=1 Tax=Rossellomorea marisflavi TaxID=189381 RepID=UPI0035A327EF